MSHRYGSGGRLSAPLGHVCNLIMKLAGSIVISSGWIRRDDQACQWAAAPSRKFALQVREDRCLCASTPGPVVNSLHAARRKTQTAPRVDHSKAIISAARAIPAPSFRTHATARARGR